MTQRTFKRYKCECPLCYGTGEIVSRQYPPYLRKKARELYARGVSLRKIGDKIGIKNSPQKVKSIIMAKTL